MLKPNRLFWSSMLMSAKGFKMNGKFAITKSIIRGVVLLIIAMLISVQFHLTAEALTSKRLLSAALSELQIAQPGQIAHSSYSLFNRVPPQQLEPSDPYHMPYKQLWTGAQVQETWIEVGPENKIVRWRTQLFSNEGDLIQDLMFDGKDETDYFPLEGRATKFPMPTETYQDEQAVLFASFLKSMKAVPKQIEGVDGKEVLSVYTEALPVREQQIDVESALLSLSSPFVADLKPSSLANRVDFDPSTRFPVGDGTLVVDQLGMEHLISYRSLLKKENLTLESSKKDALFLQTIPDQAFADSVDLSGHVQTFVGLDTIAKHIDYPIYVSHDGNNTLKLVAASLAIPDSNYSPPGYMRGITFAPQQGPGVNTVYANTDNSIVVSIIQGRTPEIKAVLKQTIPTWMRAEQVNMTIGQKQVVGWILHPQDVAHRYYVLEVGESMLYIDSRGLPNEQSLEFLRKLTLLGETQSGSKLFLPMIRNS